MRTCLPMRGLNLFLKREGGSVALFPGGRSSVQVTDVLRTPPSLQLWTIAETAQRLIANQAMRARSDTAAYASGRRVLRLSRDGSTFAQRRPVRGCQLLPRRRTTDIPAVHRQSTSLAQLPSLPPPPRPAPSHPPPPLAYPPPRAPPPASRPRTCC